MIYSSCTTAIYAALIYQQNLVLYIFLFLVTFNAGKLVFLLFLLRIIATTLFTRMPDFLFVPKFYNWRLLPRSLHDPF